MALIRRIIDGRRSLHMAIAKFIRDGMLPAADLERSGNVVQAGQDLRDGHPVPEKGRELGFENVMIHGRITPFC